MGERIFVINPGSTSTKIAFYEGGEQKWFQDLKNDKNVILKFAKVYDQLEYRYKLIVSAAKEYKLNWNKLSAVVARGGLLPPPLASGAYEVNEEILNTLQFKPVLEHASNLGAGLAYQVAKPLKIPAYIYDPITVDEMLTIVRITGLKDIIRHGQGHNLNMRATALKYCEDTGRDYYRSNLLVAHLGGGVTLSLHMDGRIIDMLSDEDGPFSPERAGKLPAYKLAKKIFDGQYDYGGIMSEMQHHGGLMSYFGTSDFCDVERKMQAGDKDAELILGAMALSVSKSIGELAVVTNGKIDTILLTGNIAFSKLFTDKITARVSFIAPVIVYPGQNEMEALAKGVLRVLNGQEKAKCFPAGEVV